MVRPMRLDCDISFSDVQQLANADAVVAFFARLGYNTDVRTEQPPENLGITANGTRRPIKKIDSAILELAEPKSVSYHGPGFFLEVLPRKRCLTLLLSLDFNEVDDPEGIAEDATQWKFFANAQHEGGVTVSVYKDEDIELVMPIVRQAYTITRT